MAQTHRGVQHFDLFDGPPWDAKDFWDWVPKPRSRWVVIGQLIASLLACLAVPACFVGTLATLLWGLDKIFSGLRFF